MCASSALCHDPWPVGHRWLVADMLAMTTLQIGHPVTIFVKMKSDNGLLHPGISLSPS